MTALCPQGKPPAPHIALPARPCWGSPWPWTLCSGHSHPTPDRTPPSAPAAQGRHFGAFARPGPLPGTQLPNSLFLYLLTLWVSRSQCLSLEAFPAPRLCQGCCIPRRPRTSLHSLNHPTEQSILVGPGPHICISRGPRALLREQACAGPAWSLLEPVTG